MAARRHVKDTAAQGEQDGRVRVMAIERQQLFLRHAPQALGDGPGGGQLEAACHPLWKEKWMLPEETRHEHCHAAH
eukprot:CAMPEP_0118970044 /NCGR_PEP_ID=MMETSP1173-20130426/7029_1 /TAXON_ID=1034831 /ORGANISM="Rhizochromulina marina cf, Strain CCMP1243" /LENGTH=75 /DNA_ID=CAMNT_0006919353 /DNA_START=734 /DNA_END=958 /DNA_ORIENTATION=-